MAPRLAPNYSDAEASHVSAQATPGGVFLRMRREFSAEQAGGIPVRRMFSEMTLSDARAFHKKLGEAIGVAAAAAAAQPSGLDGGARL